MPSSSLLYPQDPLFPFEHDQMHRTMFYNLPAGSGVGANPALLDPVIAAAIPAGWWNFNHSQAHQDFANAFPAVYWPSTVSLADIDLMDGPTQFWGLANKLLHDLAASLLPTNE